MHIRYVEDARADVLALRWMFRNNSDVQLSSCERIDELSATRSDAPIDVLLIDLRRPDAVSPEADVEIARQFTNAPILFLTGVDCGKVRERILRAGAEAVLSKEATSPELICQFAENAVVRARLSAQSPQGWQEDLIGPQAAPLADWWQPNATLSSVDTALGFVEKGLAALATNDTGAGPSNWLAANLVAMVRRIRQLGQRDFEFSELCDAADIVLRLRNSLLSAADELGVGLVLAAKPPAPFYAIGSAADAGLGIEAIVLGLLHYCGPGRRLHVEVAGNAEETRLRIRGDRHLLPGGALFFPAPSGTEAFHHGLACLQCGAALLGLRLEQIRFDPKEPDQLEIYL